MEKFVDESKNVERNDLYLYQAYDHEQALIDSTYEDAFEEGYEKAYDEAQLKIIKRMRSLGKPIDDIAECLGLSVEKVEEYIESIKETSE